MKPRLTVVGRIINNPTLQKSPNSGNSYLVLDLKCTWTERKQNEVLNLYSTYRVNILGQKALDASYDLAMGDVIEIQCSLQSQEKSHNNLKFFNYSLIGFDYEKLNKPANGNTTKPQQSDRRPPQQPQQQQRPNPPQSQPQYPTYQDQDPSFDEIPF